MSTRQFIIAALCIAAAFVLCWYSKDGAIAFLTLLGGSPIAPANHPPIDLSANSGAITVDTAPAAETQSSPTEAAKPLRDFPLKPRDADGLPRRESKRAKPRD